MTTSSQTSQIASILAPEIWRGSEAAHGAASDIILVMMAGLLVIARLPSEFSMADRIRRLSSTIQTGVSYEPVQIREPHGLSHPHSRQSAAAFKKLNPRSALPETRCMFVVAVVSALTTVLFLRDLVTRRRKPRLLLPDQSSGSGSRCFLPTSPKLSPKVAARRRRIRCARPRTETQAKLLTGR